MIPEWMRALLGATAAPGLDEAMPWLLGAALFGYLLGSIPFGLLLAKAMGLGDLRAIGSGNIGATNVLRTGNKKAAAGTLLLDALKGVAAVLIVRQVAGIDAAAIAGAMAVVGHSFPIWLKFKGGKGVATFLGIMLALHLTSGLICCAIWVGMAKLFRFSSLSALVAVAAGPLSLMYFERYEAWALIALIAVLVWVRHHANIARLLAGTEPRIGDKG
ncbi:MAG: glycerol-3-phosphate acyltransferase PlsY [Paracoccaceae bacterium]|jgi:glycerol-3-phosphate acyltransferase PlsY